VAPSGQLRGWPVGPSNSWGTKVGDAGYFYLSYDYLRTYAKYGFIITQVRTDMV